MRPRRISAEAQSASGKEAGIGPLCLSSMPHIEFGFCIKQHTFQIIQYTVRNLTNRNPAASLRKRIPKWLATLLDVFSLLSPSGIGGVCFTGDAHPAFSFKAGASEAAVLQAEIAVGEG